MKKTFEHKGIKVIVKTNFLSDGIASFHGADVGGFLKEAVKTVNLEKDTEEVITVTVFSYLRDNKIAPTAVIMGNIEHNGEKITDLGKFGRL